MVFLDAAIASTATRILTHPLDTIRIQQQSHTGRSRPSISHSIRYIYKNHQGIRGFYRGVGISIALTAPASTLYLGTYDSVLQFWNRKYPVSEELSGKLSNAPSFGVAVSATAAELISGVMWTPMEVLKARLIVYKSDINLANTSRSSSLVETINVARKIIAEDGITGLYRGYLFSLAVFIPQSITYFWLYTDFKHRLHKRVEKYNEMHHGAEKLGDNAERLFFLANFISSGTAAGLAAVVSTQLDLIKTRWQVGLARKSNSSTETSKPTIISMVKKMWKEEGGYRAFTRGTLSRVLWVSPSMAIYMAIYEQLLFYRFSEYAQ